MNISVSILAGGHAKRLGGAFKPLLSVGNESIILRQLNVLRKIVQFSQICVISEHRICACIPSYADIFEGIGPLAGVHSALYHNQQADFVFVLSGDMPFLNEMLIKHMFSIAKCYEYDVIVPWHQKGVEPLHALYRSNVLGILEQQILRQQFKVQLLFANLNTFYFDARSYEPHISFMNINTEEDIVQANRYIYEKFTRDYRTNVASVQAFA